MCGIAGLIDLRGREVRKETIKIMTDAIKHRGPDGEGQWVYQNVGIGHRRLAIIDLTEAAAQPMLSVDQRYILSYNGEIYNYKEIREELEVLGYNFYSQSDTEVLLASLIVWREKALLKFNGMFAFVFFDKIKGEILLARDRYGVKPLYYSLQDSIFAFGSEQKAIKAQNRFRSSLDKEALVEYMTFQNIFTDKTLEKDIKILEAGHYLLVNTKTTSQLTPVQYWDYHFVEPERPMHENEYVEELDRLFRQAVKRTLISDVEIGAYLSGGIDSGSITAIASQQNSDLKTFTIGFDLSSASGIELGFDESAQAKALSDKFRTTHREKILKAGDMEQSLEKLAWHIEEPRVGQSYPNMYAAQLASEWVKVVLSGTGGDELFGGYPWRYYRVAGSRNFKEYIDDYYLYWQRMVDNESLKRIFKPIQSEIAHVWTRDIFQNVFKNHSNKLSKPEDYVNHSLYFEAKTFLHGLFVIEDKLSMAFGLETRVPFMDNELVDFSMKLPVKMKIRSLHENIRIDENSYGGKKEDYYSRTSDGKILLRNTLSRYVEKEVVERRKQGFSSPDSSWFKGESMKYIKAKILDRSNYIYGIFSFDIVQSMVNEHITGKRNRRLLIWSLLHLSYYFKQSAINRN